MNRVIVQSSDGVTLVGGGPVARRDLAQALALAPNLVAADGGADRCLKAGAMPHAVIGDFDSISAHARKTIPQHHQHLIAEQESTDFDKALRSIAAPFVLALGFTGARVDHGLAVFNALVRSDQPCVVVGTRDVVFHARTAVTLNLRSGTRLSLFPMAPVQGESTGLAWPITGLHFAPGGRIGTSNRVTGPVTLRFTTPGMLIILPRACLPEAIAAVRT